MYITNLSLPNTIPANVAESLDAIKAKPYVTGAEPERPRYGNKQVSNALEEYLETLFPFPIRCVYCFQKHGLPIRVDDGNEYRIIYTLESGGDATTNTVRVFDAPAKLAESKDINVNEWYSIQTSKYYLSEISTDETRITLEVVPLASSSEVATFIASNSI